MNIQYKYNADLRRILLHNECIWHSKFATIDAKTYMTQAESILQMCMGATGVGKMVGPSCSELILCYTILGGSHHRFPKVGRVRTRATRAVAAPMQMCDYLLHLHGIINYI